MKLNECSVAKLLVCAAHQEKIKARCQLQDCRLLIWSDGHPRDRTQTWEWRTTRKCLADRRSPWLPSRSCEKNHEHRRRTRRVPKSSDPTYPEVYGSHMATRLFIGKTCSVIYSYFSFHLLVLMYSESKVVFLNPIFILDIMWFNFYTKLSKFVFRLFSKIEFTCASFKTLL